MADEEPKSTRIRNLEKTILTLDRKNRYYFFNSPDHHDIPKKLFFAAKSGFATGCVLGFYRALPMYPRSMMEFANYSARYPALWTGGSLLYAGTSCAVANYRQKSDVWNQIAASAALGTMMGIYHNSFTAGCQLTLLFCGISAFIRNYIPEDGQYLNSVDFPRKLAWHGEETILDLTFGKPLAKDPGRRSF